MRTVLLTVLGAGLIVLALRDVFHTLFHPLGNGQLSQPLVKRLWRAFRLAGRWRPTALEIAGPFAMVAVIGTWTVVLTLGWALVLWPHLPDAYVFATGLDAASQDDFLDAVYLSLVTLATLGYGDIVPRSEWLRVLSPLEALIGFGLLTSAISWVLSVYPVLGRRRTLAREVQLLRAGAVAGGVPIDTIESDALASTLADLTSRLVVVHQDLAQFPITYYFHGSDPSTALGPVLSALLRLADAACAPERPPTIRFRGAALRQAIDELMTAIGEDFLGTAGTTDELIAAYIADHRWPER